VINKSAPHATWSHKRQGGEANQGFPAAMDLPLPETIRKGDMLYRPLGRTGESVSIVGLGGSHLGRMDSEQETIRLIRRAVDHGVTFMDNSWDYHEGVSEQRMGKALEGGYRDRVCLMTKFDGRTRDSAARQIDESLKRLRVDCIDLIQLHEVIRLEDPDLFFAEEGAFEAVRRAKEVGKVRFIGFTGHKDPLVHQRMLSHAAEHGVRFDTVQMPLNVLDAHFRSFQNHVLPMLVREGIGVLGMKSMGNGDILESGMVTPIECLHYAMSLPTAVVITGIESMELLDQALEAVRTFSPLSRHEIDELVERTRTIAEKGSFERFKTGTVYDSTARHPEWLL
jgi:aryl-alcohol dehydrogenase-like predicted oxidoreductase